VARLVHTRESNISHAKKRHSTGKKIWIFSPFERSYRMMTIQLRDDAIPSLIKVEDLGASDGLDLVSQSGYRQGDTAILILPRYQAILKTLRIPSVETKRIALMMAHEIRSLVPWGEEDALWGYRIIQRDEEGYGTVLVSALQQEYVANHYDALVQSGIELTNITLSTHALNALAALLPDQERPAILHIGNGIAEYVRLSDRNVAFSRGVNSGADPSVLYQQSLDLDVRRHGDDSRHTSLICINEDPAAPHAKNAVPGATSLEELKLDDWPNASDAEAIGIGAALNHLGSPETENLLPETALHMIQRRKVLNSAKWFSISFSCLIALVVVLGWFYVSQEQAIIENTRAELELLEQTEGDLLIQHEELNQYKKEYKSVSRPLEVILALYDLTPQQIAINRYRYSENGPVILGGEATSMNALFAYMETLQKSSLFSKIDLDNNVKPPTSINSLVDFKITCTLRDTK